MKKKILFVCYGGGHAEIIAPLYNEALKRGHSIEVLALTTAYKKLSEKNINCTPLSSFLHLFPSKVKNWGEKLSSTLPTNPNVTSSETVAYLGLGYWDLITKFGEEGAASKYKELGRKAFSQTTIAEVILKKLDVNVCITTSSPRMEEAFIKSSKKLGIASYMVLENFNMPDYKSKFCKENYADVIFCPNLKSKTLLEGFGRSENALMVTGNPAFEKHFAPHVLQEGLKLRETYLKGKKLILFAMAPKDSRFYEFDTKIRSQLIKECLKLNYTLLLKPHPTDHDFTSKDAVVATNQELGFLLNACDTLVTQVSTVGQEAFILGKETIHILDEKTDETHGFSYEGIGLKKVGLKSDILTCNQNETKESKPQKHENPSLLIWDKIEKDFLNE